jgi:hypothetical protein
MSKVTGKVLLHETGVGIPNLVVTVYDVDSNTLPKDVLQSKRMSLINFWEQLQGNRLGSILSDQDGTFVLEYEDKERKEERPDLLLFVTAPEGSSLDGCSPVLRVSGGIRQNAGRIESYLIRIPTQKLAAAGLSAPTGIVLDAEEPEAVIQKVNLAVSRQVKIKREVQKIAAQQVEAERLRTAQIETEVERRLLEKLTGVPDKLAERLNYVRPGGDVELAMFQAIKKSIEGTINKNPPAKGFVVLSEEQVQQFKNPDGTFRDKIPPAEMEPYLFGSQEESKRSTFLIRENPLELLRKSQVQPELLEGDGGTRALSITDAINGPVGPSEDSPVTASPETIPDFVGRLIGTMTSPEEAVAFGVKPRATQDEVQGEINAFQLRSGPADVPAFYDFHSLQIAFDYVWQKAIDEGVIENTKVLSRQLMDLGGDPLGAISNGADPIKALRKELQTVQTAHASSNLTVMFRAKNQETNGSPAGPNGAGGFPPHGGVSGPGHHGNTTGTTSGTLSQGEQGEESDPLALLNQIESLLNERYAFEIFAPGSGNFGILVSYRQRWAPINYQVGNLIKTITLTPKETRKVSTKRVVKKDRSVKEMEDSLRIRKEESSNTARDEAEIIAKAEAKTNFSLTAKGSYNIGIAKGDSTTVFGKDVATNSSDTKKAFREAVIKAAQEYKDERKLEVETKEAYEEEVSESSEITNPNDELPVTYLFYELQRRYKISETIHRLTPVVLVAMDVPNPSRRAIDALLLTHGWIIDRVLLDDQFRKPLEYFRTKIVGEEFALKTMEQNLAVMRGVVEELKKSYTQARENAKILADLLTAQTVVRAQATQDEKSEGWWEKGKETLVGEGDDIDVEAARILEDAAREKYERAVNQERELRTQLDSETAALKAANDAFAKAKAEHLNCLMDVGTLRLHIKENILYYMQAIWSHTFQDQIFLALHKKKVPRLTPREKNYSLSQPNETPSSVTAKTGQVVLAVEANVELESEFNPDDDFVTLAEVADLDNLMGFKGNYLIFPLKVSNALTDFMMTPYVDSELGLRDPDEFGNFTPEEFVAYARALNEQMQEQLQKGEITEEEVQATIDRLSEQYKRLLSAPRRAEDEIIVPTGSLYIEALPGVHPILEDFKLMHRAIDVKKVQAEVRKLEMENIRYAARILANEREDPNIDQRVLIQGEVPGVVVPPPEH